MEQEQIASLKEQLFGQPSTQSPTPDSVPPVEPVIVAATEPAVVPPAETIPADTPPVITSIIDEQTWKTAQAELEELRQYKANPVVVQPTYENEESKAIAEALADGKFDVVFETMEKQNRLSRLTTGEVTKENAPDIIKTYFKEKYQGLTHDQITYKFNKQFAVPPKPVEASFDGDAEAFQLAQSEWQQKATDAEMDLLIEANLARPELEKLKKEIKLPKIEQPSNAVDESYKTYKENIEKAAEDNKILLEKLSGLSEKDVSIQISFNDEAKKVKFDIDHQPQKEKFDKARAAVADYVGFLSQNYYTEDGSPLVDKLASDIYFLQNRDEIISQMITQAVNNTMLDIARNQKNIGGGIQRNFNVVQPDAIQLYKEQVFGKTGTN